MTDTHAVDAPASVVEPDAPAFHVDGVAYRWGHVFAHARRTGDWRIVEAEVRQAEACLRLADEEGSPLPHGAERRFATAFRRARRLHAAEDLEAWLEARELTVAQWRRHIRGEALRHHHAAELDTIVARTPISDATIEAALGPWGRCSGAFHRWAAQLATRAAAAHAVCERDDQPPPPPDDLVRLERLDDRFAAAVATRERLEALLAARYLDWLCLDTETSAFPDRDTAAEALLCVRDDGWSLTEATQAGRGRLRRHRLFVEEADGDIRHHLVRARDGDLLGPLPLGGEPTLLRVLRKDAPSLEDDELRLRAHRHLVDAAAARELDDRVAWLPPARTGEPELTVLGEPGTQGPASPLALRTTVDIVQWVTLVATVAFVVLLFVA